MSLIRKESISKSTQRTTPAQPSFLANAVRAALIASSISALSSGAALAQSCETSEVSACSSAATAGLIARQQDLTTIANGSLPSAVMAVSLHADNAAIASTAPLSVRIINSGNISKEAAGEVVGLNVPMDDVAIINAGSIRAVSTDGGLADGIFNSGARNSILNTGSITALGYAWATGIENQSGDSVSIVNQGKITAGLSEYASNEFASRMHGIMSKNFGDSGTLIYNQGLIYVPGAGYNLGIFAYDGGAGGLSIKNSGDILVPMNPDDPTTPNHYESRVTTASGIFGSTNAKGGDILFNNSGNISAEAYLFGIRGVVLSAFGDDAMVSVSNFGTIHTWAGLTGLSSSSSSYALDLIADGDILISTKAGSRIDASGWGNSEAIAALSINGDIRIKNDGQLTAAGALGHGVAVDALAENGQVLFTNTGDIRSGTFVGSAAGVMIRGATGASAINSGVVSNTLSAGGSWAVHGMAALSSRGDSLVFNDERGLVTVTGIAGYSSMDGRPATTVYGIFADAMVGNAKAVNRGSVLATHFVQESPSSSIEISGVSAVGHAKANATTINSGRVQVIANDIGTKLVDPEYVSFSGPLAGINGEAAIGLSVIADAGNAVAINNGIVAIESSSAISFVEQAEGVGMVGRTDSGKVALSNAGTINVSVLSTGKVQDDLHGAVGMSARSVTGDLNIINSGSIQLNGIASTGMRTAGNGGNVLARNLGVINAKSTVGDAIGLAGTITAGTMNLHNGGAITVSAPSAKAQSIGILANASGGAVRVSNSGIINATSPNGESYGMLVDGRVDARLVNFGLISAQTAVKGGEGNNLITNAGTLTGALVAGGGNDNILNRLGASWDMADRVSSLGAGNDNFLNAGFLRLKDSRFDLGGGTNTFSNTGTIKLSGTNTLASGSTGYMRFANTGLLDFTNNRVGDSLAITGDFGGVGNINLDVNLTAGLGDWLSISGATFTGTKQTLNIALLDGLPASKALNKPLQLVQVSGNSNPDAFVAGRVLGVSPADFLKLDMSVAVEKQAGAKGGNYLLSITPKVAGLNASGTLVSAAAMGVDSLLSSTSGNWRDRAAMIHSSSALPSLKGITPWVRGFRDTGGMSSNNMVGNFGQAHSANLNQDNSGSEIGFNLDAGNGFSVGATVAKSEAKQYLAQGYGTDTLQGSSVGMYATWNSQGGAYIDASVRGMQFDAYLDTVAGRQQGQGNAHMLNVESGRTWTLRNGLNVEPQAQFTSTKVSGMNVQGDKAVMQTEASNWQRGRVGVSLWKAYRGVSGWNVTPYGQINAVHTLDGSLDYNINRDFHGQLNSEGTMAMFKFGLNAAKGRFNLGSALNWQSGNQLDSGLGVQTKLSYAW